MKLFRLIKMFLNETYSLCIGEHLSGSFPIQSGLNQGDALPQVLFNFALEYAIRKVQENHVEFKLIETQLFLVYADHVCLLGDKTDTIDKIRNSD
jgi:hypothetical protein